MQNNFPDASKVADRTKRSLRQQHTAPNPAEEVFIGLYSQGVAGSDLDPQQIMTIVASAITGTRSSYPDFGISQRLHNAIVSTMDDRDTADEVDRLLADHH